jgi:hypothetical protein
MNRRKIEQQLIEQAALTGGYAVEPALFLEGGVLTPENEIHDARPDSEKEQKLKGLFYWCGHAPGYCSGQRGFAARKKRRKDEKICASINLLKFSDAFCKFVAA